MKRVFISTTNSVENGQILDYYGIVSSHIVAGTGFLTDFVAGLSDIFGGRSGSYRRELESLYDDALDEISQKAHLLGANGVLGFKIDIDNISGKGMSMFMITAVGTAVKIAFTTEKEADVSSFCVSSASLVSEIAKRTLLQKLSEDYHTVTSRDWETILSHPDNDYVLPLTDRLREALDSGSDYSDYLDSFSKNFNLFIPLVDRKLIIQGLYNCAKTEKGFGRVALFIKEHLLFDAKSIMGLINEGFLQQAIGLLNLEQPSYAESDLHDMEDLLHLLKHLPEVGRKEFVKGGVFSKDGEKYICAHGHKNEIETEFCSTCGENIQGLTYENLQTIDRYKKRVEVLRDLLSEV